MSRSSGDRLVSGTEDGSLQLWQVPSGVPLHTLAGMAKQLQAKKAGSN